MGEVFEADDLELNETIALKTLRSDLATDAEAVERFRREIRLARRVTHGNVCRTFEFDILPRLGAAEGEPPVAFLTMQMLEGESLEERILRRGRLSPEETLEIARQLAAALDAAHAAGVVHRDLKPSNVLLVPGSGSTGRERAVVTDFGLAMAPGQADDSRLTRGGRVMGTIGYMAPEQLSAAGLGPAVDIFAFGVTLYRMVTGSHPFGGEASGAAESPGRLVPDLPEEWDRVILRCMARDPSKRFVSAGDAIAELESRKAPGGASKSRRAAVLAAALAGAMILALVARWRHFPASTGGPARPGAAVFAFRNLTEHPAADWLSTALPEMVATEIAAGERVRVVSREDVARLAGGDPSRIARSLGCDYVVEGSFATLGPDADRMLRVDVRIEDARSRATVAAASASGSENGLFDLVASVGSTLRRRLGTPPLTAAESESIRAAWPQDPDAGRAYAEGLAKLRRFDSPAARELFDRAAAREPSSAILHAALSSAWSASGYDAKARDEAARAAALSGSLPREDRLIVQAREAEVAKAWPRAVRLDSALVAIFPDEMNHVVSLAAALVSAGRAREALAEIGEARDRAAAPVDRARLDLASEAARFALSDFRGALADARRAGTAAEAAGAPLLNASAGVAEASALRSLGDFAGAERACQAAAAVFHRANHKAGEAKSLNELGNIVGDRGDTAGSLRYYQSALEILRETGDEYGMAAARNNIALLAWGAGDLEEARGQMEQVLTLLGRVGDVDHVAGALNNLGNIISDEGDLAGAETLYRRALESSRQTGSREGVGRAENNIAIMRKERGDLAEARRLYESVLASKREIGDRVREAATLANIAEIDLLAGDLDAAARRLADASVVLAKLDSADGRAQMLHMRGRLEMARGVDLEARRFLEEAEKLRAAQGESGSAAECRLDLARLDFDAGQFRRMAETAAAAASEYDREHARDSEAGARAIRALALNAAGDASGARRELDQAVALTARTQSVITRTEVEIVRGVLACSDRRTGDGPKLLEDAASRAAASGLAPLALTARIELARAAGNTRDLRNLGAEARKKGWIRLANRAEASRPGA